MPSQSEPSTGDRWDSRYSGNEFFFGTEPNGFLASVVDRLPKGRALCIADGEGRNSVFLAAKGWECVSMDASREGNAKAARLAARQGVELTTVQADLRDYDMGHERWDLIVSVFCHLPPSLREDVHARAVAALKPNGAFVLEAYTPEQLEYGTGGPPNAELMMTRSMLERDLQGLEFAYMDETVRDVVEGRGHNGRASVVQVLALKGPATD